MKPNLTTEQQSLFIEVLHEAAIVGIHCRYRALQKFVLRYPEKKAEAIACFAQFERSLGFCYESTEALSCMTDEAFFSHIQEHFPLTVKELVLQ